MPALDGRVDVYVPIVDWGVRASPYEPPVAIELRLRSLNREEALAALRSGAAAEERLAAIRSELADVGRDALRRAALLGVAGGLGGGLLGGGVIGAALYRRRWLAYARRWAFVPLAYGGVVLATLRDVDDAAFEQPTFHAYGRELPRLLSFSGKLLTAGERYTESYEQSLAGLANLVAFAIEGRAPGTPTTSAVLASDLHANTLVLPVLEDYTEEKTVFLVGDFTLLGTRPESRLVPLIRRLGRQVVAVSGNHDSRPFMLDLVRAGVTKTIFTGHDHEQHLDQNETGVLVDGGTVGAGGPFAIGVQPAGLAVIHLAEEGDARAVDLIEVEPLSGNARASRTAVGGVSLQD